MSENEVLDPGAPGVSDPSATADLRVESANLPEAAKEVIREVQAEDVVSRRAGTAGEAPKPAEPPVAAATDESVRPGAPGTFSEKQKQLLRETHLDEEEVSNLAPDQLDRVLDMIRKRDERLIRKGQAVQRERDEQGRFKAAALTPDSSPPAHQRPVLKKVSEGGEYDDEIVDYLNSLHGEVDQLRQETKRFDELTSRQQQALQAQQITENNAWFDEQFSKLGDEFVAVLGKGTVRDLDPHSAEFAARDAVVRLAYKMAELYPDAQPEELFRKAVAANHSDVYVQQHRARINDQVRKQSGQRLGAGSAVRAPQGELDPADPDGRLRKAFQEMLRENGSLA